MPVLAGYMVPHPPMIVPEIGRGSEREIEETINAYNRAADDIAEIKPDTIIITSPHTVMYGDYFHISPGAGAKGSFAGFGAPGVAFDEEYDEELRDMISEEAEAENFPAGTLGERDAELDHGTMVPLFFIRKKYKGAKILRIGLSGLPLSDHYKLGMMIKEAVEKLGRRAVFVASGDLSHKLKDYGPYGFDEAGPEYDERIMDVMGRAAFDELFDFEETFCDSAAECGHRSFVIMAGAFDGIKVEPSKLSHQDVTGVGYGICIFHAEEGKDEQSLVTDEERRFLDKYLAKEEKKLDERRAGSDEYVDLARDTIESFVRAGRRIEIPEGLPEDMLGKRAGAFVSLHEHGTLRGCIGTIEPVTGCVAQEIINNAVSAATRDPRFTPVRADELPYLEISVDVLGEPEPVDSEDELDVKRYGVIVTCGSRKGLLLPDIDGVDTVREQVDIAMKKGGISPDEDYSLERFVVVRHC